MRGMRLFESRNVHNGDDRRRHDADHQYADGDPVDPSSRCQGHDHDIHISPDAGCCQASDRAEPDSLRIETQG